MGLIAPDRVKRFFDAAVLAADGTFISEEAALPAGTKALTVEAKFVRAAGGTTLDCYVQTSLDGGVTWIDIMNLTFAITTANKVSAVRANIALAPAVTPTDGTLADNSIVDGLLGDRIRVKYVTVGTYSGASSLTVTAVID